MIKIELTEEFPHLSRAPIVEAVIEMRARAEPPWQEHLVLEHLKPLREQFPHLQAQKEFRTEVRLQGAEAAQTKQHDLGFKGIRARSKDSVYLAQFNRDGFVLSRLTPYQTWERFVDEAFRLWKIHNNLARVSEISRLGLRYINRIPLGKDANIERYINPYPQPPRGLEELPFVGFLYQTTLGMPGYSYIVNTVSTIEKGIEGPLDFSLILDIDVFVEQAFEPSSDSLRRSLDEMRWLKNKVFFGTIAEETLKSFK